MSAAVRLAVAPDTAPATSPRPTTPDHPPLPARRRRWTPVPTGRLAAAVAAAAVVALAVPMPAPWGLVVPLTAVAVAATVDLALAPSPRRVEVERTLPAVVSLGRGAEVVWALHHPLRRSVRVSFADELAPSLAAGARRARVVVEPGRTHRVRTSITPRRRGRFVPAELTVRTEGPLGLCARQADRLQPQELRVYPGLGARQEAELIARTRLAEVGSRRARLAGAGTDFDQLRDYGVDDDSRRIDWAATARVARPIVRTYRVERNQTLLLLVDNGRMMAGRVAGAPRVEHAMDGVLMLAAAAAAARLGDRLGLTTFDQRVTTTVAPSSGAGQMARISEALYLLAPQLVESDYRAVFASTLARVRRRSLVCLLTELADESLTETLLPALPLLVRTHLVMVGAVRDPEIDSWNGARPGTVEGAYHKAAASRAIERRRRLAATLRSMGVVVVDEAPGELAPALTDAYLRAKFTGAL